MTSYSTLVELLCDRAQKTPDKRAYTFLADGETESGTLTYGELDRQARAIATHLSSRLSPGDRALLIYPYTAGLEFIAAFMGCLYAGVIAVTDNPPRNLDALRKLQERMTLSGSTAFLTTETLATQLQSQLPKSPETAAQLSQLFVVTTDTISASPDDWHQPELAAETLAFLQYTSGSTGTPKGVMVTHGNILYNERVIQQAFQHSTETLFVGWLPLFHDMGLIGNVLQPLYIGIHSVLMSPISLIQKPVLWLEAISRYRATTSGGPNFAYELLCQKTTPEQRASLDLKSWDVAFCGAEPIRVETLEQFTHLFEPQGFRREAFYPCYGMAEASLFISGGDKSDPPVIVSIDRAALERNQVEHAEQPEAKALMGCGHAWLEDQILIVDPDTRQRCATNQVGEVWVSGPGIGQGYWQQAEATEQTFRGTLADTGEGPFLRTGDFGFLQGQELFITGRLKDMMILWGRNHYPQHIEQTVEQCHPALRSNCGAAIAVDVEDQEQLVIVQEVERTALRQFDAQEVIEAICRAVAENHMSEVYGVALLKTGSIPKTTSGKVQRRMCRAKFLDNSLNTVAQWQMTPEQRGTIVDLMARSGATG
ncbi:4-hydroxyphenylalkanoate adenylyltransferase [Acaryochloris thomasi RCC1774]|uniref:4-hydroxyphenylalkanoate adenylyltransferase n=1 Tax=Acaryochloris thomasi RCC1774 TaxID=1764569 RepID=A0A2W1JRT8_9CYAN|nr:fatty acyl-AMP ligase [Acaryochloris thomasi]PZD72724.1 4-hydroxyphenylalkanoate adenylyltransferase [Acaryochloris thomasi RCC1774]